jgi:hypothetical protein
MVNAATDHDVAIGGLLTDLRQRQKAISSFVYRRMAVSSLAWLTNAVGAFYTMRFYPVLALVLFLVGSVIHFYFVFRILPLVAEALCHRTGFTCPYCHKPLVSASSSGDEYLQRGQCPTCFQRIEPPFPII